MSVDEILGLTAEVSFLLFAKHRFRRPQKAYLRYTEYNFLNTDFTSTKHTSASQQSPLKNCIHAFGDKRLGFTKYEVFASSGTH